jgi:hypothetical protein
VYCSKCGTQNDDNSYRCTSCGALLHAEAQPVVIDETTSLGGLIPYRNPKGLIAYYLGLFSIIPMLGFFLAVPALVLGIMGVRYANRNPTAKGKIHAWVGIIGGAIFTLVWGFAFVVMIIAIVSRK